MRERKLEMLVHRLNEYIEDEETLCEKCNALTYLLGAFIVCIIGIFHPYSYKTIVFRIWMDVDIYVVGKNNFKNRHVILF